MLLRRCQFALRTLFFLPLLACSSNCFALEISRDAKAKGLAHYIMAVCDDMNEDGASAMREYQKSVKYNGAEPAPRLKLGAYFLRQNKVNQAVVQLKAVTSLISQEPQAHYLLALIYSSKHQYGLAAQEYETILKSAAQNPSGNLDAYIYLGQLYFFEGKYAKAEDQFLRIIRLDPNNASALFLLGSVYADSKNNLKAIEIFRKALKMDPDNSEALNSLGYIYAEEGIHLDEALRMVRKAIEIDPTNGAYYDSLGWALFQKKMYTESLMVLQKAERFIQDEILYDHLGDVFDALKQNAQACRYWHKSLDLNPHQPLVQQKIKRIEKCAALRPHHQLN